jgi:hypothetical protein
MFLYCSYRQKGAESGGCDMYGKGFRRRKVLRFTALRRETYLEVLAETGNKRAAAEAIGFRRNRMDGIRKRDPAFAADCEAALRAADARLKDSDWQFEGVDQPEFQTLRQCRNGRVQIIAVGPGRWSKRVEDRFLAILSQCGNVEASARAVGFAGTDIFRRQRQWPGFARRMEEAHDEADVRLEFRLACWGNTVPPDGGESATECPEVPFDPEFALRYLKWRQEKKAGRGRRGRVPEPPSIEAVTEKIVRKVEAIKRHRARDGLPPAPKAREGE